MGLDFRIDETPKVWIRKLPGVPLQDVCTPWEESTISDMLDFAENAQWEGPNHPVEFRYEPPPPLDPPPPANYPRWSYGGFARFRERLFNEARNEDWPINMRLMWGHRPISTHEIYALRYGHEVATVNLTDWNKFEKEQHEWWSSVCVQWEDLSWSPIIPLLNHSDCDGDLEPEICAAVAPELRRLVANWDDEMDYDKQSALALADYMDCCAANGRRLIFC